MTDPLQDIMKERARQDEIWGEQNHNDYYWLGILVEEVGETSKALIEDKAQQMKKELTEVAAVALAWLECINRRDEIIIVKNPQTVDDFHKAGLLTGKQLAELLNGEDKK